MMNVRCVNNENTKRESGNFLTYLIYIQHVNEKLMHYKKHTADANCKCHLTTKQRACMCVTTFNIEILE